MSFSAGFSLPSSLKNKVLHAVLAFHDSKASWSLSTIFCYPWHLCVPTQGWYLHPDLEMWYSFGRHRPETAVLGHSAKSKTIKSPSLPVSLRLYDPQTWTGLQFYSMDVVTCTYLATMLVRIWLRWFNGCCNLYVFGYDAGQDVGIDFVLGNKVNTHSKHSDQTKERNSNGVNKYKDYRPLAPKVAVAWTLKVPVSCQQSKATRLTIEGL